MDNLALRRRERMILRIALDPTRIGPLENGVEITTSMRRAEVGIRPLFASLHVLVPIDTRVRIAHEHLSEHFRAVVKVVLQFSS